MQPTMSLRPIVTRLETERARLDRERARVDRVLVALAPAVALERKPLARATGRRPMTPAQRKAVSRRMRAYWAGRRKSARRAS